MASAVALAQPLETTLSPVQTSVSGSLNPLVIAVDGKKIIREKETLLSVVVNGKAITPKKSKGSPFFMRVETDLIRVEGQAANGLARQWDLELPSALVEKADSKKIFFKISGVASRVTIDGNPIPYKGSRAMWVPPSGKKAFAKTWVLELTAQGKPGRLYNLRLAPGSGEGDRGLASESRLRMGLSAADFRVSQISVFQKGGGNTFSFHLAWAPYFYFSPSFGAGLELGGALFKSSIDNSGFFVIDTELVLGWFGKPIGIELRAGAQTWLNNGGTSPLGGVTLNYLFSRNGLIDRIFLAYTYYLSSFDPSHQVRIGLGISL